MKEIKSFYKGSLFVAIVVLCACFMVQNRSFFSFNNNPASAKGVENTNFGAFLAAQHALYINDFDSASKLINTIEDDTKSVREAKIITNFFNGKIPENAEKLKDSKDGISRLVYEAYLINQDEWKSVYERHKNDESIISAPLRIFSAAKQGKTKEALKFVDSLKTSTSWKSFIRGQIAVLNDDVDAAAKEFAQVNPEFMNINDYLYLMSFYKKNGMDEDVEILRKDFMENPSGAIVLDFQEIPDWSNFEGYKNNLAFSFIQTISHAQIMIYTDLSLAFLRFAQIISDGANIDAINYYMGQYYIYNSGDFEKRFNAISKSSPFYLFGQLAIADKNNNFAAIEKLARQNPSFVSAVGRAIPINIKNGNKRAALKLVNRALKEKNIPDSQRQFFLKQRAHVHLMFNDSKSAQKDLDEAMEIDGSMSPENMLLQARIWQQQNRNLDDAYNYTMDLIKTNTSDVYAWDLLGLIVEKKEGINNAIEIFERISSVATLPSMVYEHMGDLYAKQGDTDRAKRAYSQALDLSEDCLIIVPNVQKKLRKLK